MTNEMLHNYPPECDRCGTIGNIEDGIEVGGECANEDCGGTIFSRASRMLELTMEDVRDTLRSFNERLEALEALLGEMAQQAASGFEVVLADLDKQYGRIQLEVDDRRSQAKRLFDAVRNLEGQVSEMRGE